MRAKAAGEAEKAVEQAKAALADAEAKLAGADDAGKEAAEASVAAAKERLGKIEKAAAIVAGGGTIAEALIENGASPDNRVTVTVIGPAKGRRRAGYQFGANPLTVEVTLDELKLIEGDAELAVTPGAGPVTEAGVAPKRLPLEAFLGADGKPGPVTVLGPAKGRRRAGRSFGAGAVTFTPTREELELILGDAELSVAPARGETAREDTATD
jgi:hypothetical protein